MLLAIWLCLGSVQMETRVGYDEGARVVVSVRRIPGADEAGPLYLQSDAAEAWLALVEYAAANGVYLKANYGFRTDDQQRRLYRQSRRLAARPGHSNHQLGLSVDVAGTTRLCPTCRRTRTPTYYWLLREAPRFGFVNDIPREKWHWTYRLRDLSLT